MVLSLLRKVHKQFSDEMSEELRHSMHQVSVVTRKTRSIYKKSSTQDILP